MRRGVRGLVSEGGESSVGVAKMRVEGATGGTLLGTMLIVRREWNEDREEEERVEKKDEGREGEGECTATGGYEGNDDGDDSMAHSEPDGRVIASSRTGGMEGWAGGRAGRWMGAKWPACWGEEKGEREVVKM